MPHLPPKACRSSLWPWVRWLWLWALGPALAQWVALEPLGSPTLAATWNQVLSGQGTWVFQAQLRYVAPASGSYRVLLQAVPAAEGPVVLRVFLTPGTPERLGGAGSLGTLALSGRTEMPPGFQALLVGASGVEGLLPLTLELVAQGTGPLPPGYLFLQVTALILPD